MVPRSCVPSILLPEYTWPCPTAHIIAAKTPPIPAITRPWVRRLWGFLHRGLALFSRTYCSWTGAFWDPSISDLPFGLVLKWSERTRIEEVAAMQMARAAGMPVPYVLCVGEHTFDERHRTTCFPISILMTRLPGWPLQNTDEPWVAEEEVTWFADFKKCIDAMREWKPHFENKVFTSVIGTSISSPRIPSHEMGPFTSHDELQKALIAPAWNYRFDSVEHYEATLKQAKELVDMPHANKFTHGDLKTHNILIDRNYRLSGILDWECAGWCPEYWDFTTAMRMGRGSWWYHGIDCLGGNRYRAQLECDRALNRLTVDSYAM